MRPGAAKSDAQLLKRIEDVDILSELIVSLMGNAKSEKVKTPNAKFGLSFPGWRRGDMIQDGSLVIVSTG